MWATACCAALRRRAGRCARSRNPERMGPLPGVEQSGATSSPATASTPRSTACAAPTTWCTRWRRARTGTSPAATAAPPRPSRRRGARRGRADRLPRGSRRPAGSPPPPLAPRGRGDPARGRAWVHRAARLDRDRRRLVLVPCARPTGGAPAGAADAGLALEPHAADRRARRDRVPRPHPRHAGRRRPLAGRMRPGRDDLRGDDRAIADSMGVGRMPFGFSARTRRPRARWWPPSAASRSSSSAP